MESARTTKNVILSFPQAYQLLEKVDRLFLIFGKDRKCNVIIRQFLKVFDKNNKNKEEFVFLYINIWLKIYSFLYIIDGNPKLRDPCSTQGKGGI